MPAGDTNGPRSSRPLCRRRRRRPGLPARTFVYEVLPPEGVPACLHPAGHLPCPSSRSSRVPVAIGDVPLPFGVKHPGAATGPAASSWHPCVYWRFCGSVGPFSLSTTRRSQGHHDSVPAGAQDAALPLSRLRGPYISVAGPSVAGPRLRGPVALPLSWLRVAKPAHQFRSDCPRGGPTWSENTGFGQRGVSTGASPVMPG
ncbi:hypothetical protein MRX96_044993 [Rhipicephalus microplus]